MGDSNDKAAALLEAEYVLRQLNQSTDPVPMLVKVMTQWRASGVREGKATQATALQHNAAEVESLRETLQFVERWANHHGQKDFISPADALSCIQHYPPILEITRGYADGKVPETPNPWAEVERLTRELAEARNAALEEAAVVCNERAKQEISALAPNSVYRTQRAIGAEKCAAIIRSLKSKEPATPTEQEG